MRNIELDYVNELNESQLSYINAACKEFNRHQEELKELINKQKKMSTAIEDHFQHLNE